MFVTFEGPDGAGKSTALRTVAERLRQGGRIVATTRQPGDCSIGPDVRRLLLESHAIEPAAELFLYLADRTQNVSEIIRPALARGEVVLCDRYSDSTVVYQGHARGHERDLLIRLNEMATGGLKPDLTLLLDLPAEVGIGRLEKKDRLDAESTAFHAAVRDGFLAEARLDPERYRVIDARQPVEEVAGACFEAIESALASKNP